MKLDIKLPIGLMFAIFGIILTLYGIFTGSNQTLYDRSLGVNVNLYTGILMLVFGLVMLLAARKTRNETR